MSIETIRIEGTARLTPQLMAEMFWEMNSSEHADFFGCLEQIAGIKLCFQMAAVVSEIQERADRGDYTAQQGFQTMLAHAQGYAEAATDYRVSNAKYEIYRMCKGIREAMEVSA